MLKEKISKKKCRKKIVERRNVNFYFDIFSFDNFSFGVFIVNRKNRMMHWKCHFLGKKSTGLRKMFCPQRGIAPMANGINIEFYTK